MDNYIAYFDGASKNNPKGPTSIGYIIYKDDIPIVAVGSLIENQTNNYAEYKAFILLVRQFTEYSIKKSNIIIRGDSSIVINQLLGNFKVKAENLKEVYQEALNEYLQLKSLGNIITLELVPRAKNTKADELANSVFN